MALLKCNQVLIERNSFSNINKNEVKIITIPLYVIEHAISHYFLIVTEFIFKCLNTNENNKFNGKIYNGIWNIRKKVCKYNFTKLKIDHTCKRMEWKIRRITQGYKLKCVRYLVRYFWNYIHIHCIYVYIYTCIHDLCPLCVNDHVRWELLKW